MQEGWSGDIREKPFYQFIIIKNKNAEEKSESWKSTFQQFYFLCLLALKTMTWLLTFLTKIH